MHINENVIKKIDPALRERLIEDARGYLDGYHIDLTEYDASLEEDDDITVSIVFMARDSRKKITLETCYFNEKEILRVMGIELS